MIQKTTLNIIIRYDNEIDDKPILMNTPHATMNINNRQLYFGCA